MQLLEAVNIVLRMNGLPPINRIEEEEPTSRRMLDFVVESRRAILSSGFRWNTNVMTLSVDDSGRVPINGSWLETRFNSSDLTTRLDEDDGKLYVWSVNENDWHGSSVTKAEIVFDVQSDNFATIPEAFARWIAVNAAHLAWLNRNGASGNPVIGGELRRAGTDALNSDAERAASVNRMSGWDARRRRYMRTSLRSG
jgi:hypothetical protein